MPSSHEGPWSGVPRIHVGPRMHFWQQGLASVVIQVSAPMLHAFAVAIENHIRMFSKGRSDLVAQNLICAWTQCKQVSGLVAAETR